MLFQKIKLLEAGQKKILLLSLIGVLQLAEDGGCGQVESLLK